MPDPVPTFGQICVEAINLAAHRPICGTQSARIIDAMLLEHLRTPPKGRAGGSPGLFGDRKAIPPTPELVWAYAASLGEPVVDGHAFCDFYQSKGWLVGKVKMKDWQATVRTWMRRNTTPKDKPNNYREF